MAIAQHIANGNPDAESVQENIIQKNAIVQQFNASIARTHMKHGVMSVLHGSRRNIDLKNCEIALLTSSSSKLLLFFFLLGLAYPRMLQFHKIEYSKTKNTG